MRIRAAQEDDARAIADLVVGLSREFEEEARASAAYVRKFLRTPQCHVLLALEDGDAVGILSYSVRPSLYHGAPSLFIEELFVERQFRKAGVASALLKRVLKLAKTMKCIEISVSTGFGNRRAIALYGKHGLKDRSLLLESHLE
jgi:GNAT superfamily N-acetyltransferase